MSKQYLDFTKLHRPRAHWSVTKGYDEGVILLPDGVVEVMMQGDDEHQPLTRLDTVVRGHHVILTVYKRYSRRGVIGLARKLLRDLSTGDGQ